MRRWIRAVPVVLVGVLAVIVTANPTEPMSVTRAGAATPASSSPVVHDGTKPARAKAAVAKAAVAKPASGSSTGSTAGVLQITPVGADTTSGAGPGVGVALDPGASAVRSFVVANRSAALVLTVRLTTVDATRGTDGTVHYASSAAAGTPATWLTLSDIVATLEPHATLRMSVTMAPPANAAPGAVLAGVVARVDSAVRVGDQATVAEHASVTLPVAIQLKGAATALVSIVGARLERAGGRDLLEITFENAGATPNTMIGRVDVRGPTPRTEPIRASVAALTHTSVRVPFTMPSGAKTVPISVVASDAGGDQASWTGSVGLAPEPAPHSSGPVPRPSTVHGLTATLAAHGATKPRLALLLVVLVFAATAMWFGAELRRNRKARRAIKRAAVVPAAAPGLVAIKSPTPVYAAAAAAGEPMGAVAAQLGALVEALDRLVIRLDGSALDPGRAPRREAGRASGTAPAAAGVVPSRAESGALLYAPAAGRVPEASPDDLYDWPTEAQLAQFAARRTVAPADGD